MSSIFRTSLDEVGRAQLAQRLATDRELSLKARGLALTLLARLPDDDGGYTFEQLLDLALDARSSVRTAVTELRERGYLERVEPARPGRRHAEGKRLDHLLVDPRAPRCAA